MDRVRGTAVSLSRVLPIESQIVVSLGAARDDRRLSDKILAAFTHAYASGHAGLAATLRRALEDAERAPGREPCRRRDTSALRQADLWIGFVDARDAYRRAAERTPADAEEVELARLEMLSAYRRWSEG